MACDAKFRPVKRNGRSPLIVTRSRRRSAALLFADRAMLGAAIVPHCHGILLPSEAAGEIR